jgi:hypothetical protein
MSTVRISRDHQFAYEDVPPRLPNRYDDERSIVEVPEHLWLEYAERRDNYLAARAVLDDLLDAERWRREDLEDRAYFLGMKDVEWPHIEAALIGFTAVGGYSYD